jgi:hypothetical protein
LKVKQEEYEKAEVSEDIERLVKEIEMLKLVLFESVEISETAHIFLLTIDNDNEGNLYPCGLNLKNFL